MKFNLVPNNILTAEVGFKVLTEADLVSLSDGTTVSGGVSITAGQTMSVICDLKARYNLDYAYYFRSAASSEVIIFHARQNSADTWATIPHSVSGNQLIATLSGTTNRYQFLRLQHQVNTGTATAREFQVFTSDDEVLFGSPEQGERISYDMNAGTEDIVPQPVHITNPDTAGHNFYVLLDADNAKSFELQLASDIGGPYHSIYSTGKSLPTTFAWANGSFTNTEVSAGNVVTLAPAQASGFYYSPVIDMQSVNGRRLFWKTTASGTSVIDTTTLTSNAPTVSVRMSDVAPSFPWVDGQLSTDSQWSVVSGTLTFEEFDNNTILDPRYKRYFQARVSFTGTDHFPKLEALGIEEGFLLDIGAGQSAPVYVRVSSNAVTPVGTAALVSWYFEDRTLEN